MIEEIIKKFNIEGEIDSWEINHTGIINSTYVVTTKLDNGEKRQYLLQKINTNVFSEPFILMKNIEEVTSYLETQMQKEDDDKHQVLHVVHTKTGKALSYIEEASGERDYYRVYNYIANAVTYNKVVDKKIVFQIGKAWGHFQRLLRNYPMRRLTETIPDFHNTEARYYKLLDDIKFDSEGRVMEVTPEIVFILMRSDICPLITEQLGTPAVPWRVTHNDTKVNNVLMNQKTNEFLAVIDLDTVMPGSVLFDYGDGIRSTASTAEEDEEDISKIALDLDLFEAYTDGYLSEMAEFLTYEEVALMPDAIRLMALELSIRFLDDYINGDTYFKISYEKHNLIRTRNQQALVVDIESKLDYMRDFVRKCHTKYIKKKK